MKDWNKMSSVVPQDEKNKEYALWKTIVEVLT